MYYSQVQFGTMRHGNKRLSCRYFSKIRRPHKHFYQTNKSFIELKILGKLYFCSFLYYFNIMLLCSSRTALEFFLQDIPRGGYFGFFLFFLVYVPPPPPSSKIYRVPTRRGLLVCYPILDGCRGPPAGPFFYQLGRRRSRRDLLPPYLIFILKFVKIKDAFGLFVLFSSQSSMKINFEIWKN